MTLHQKKIKLHFLAAVSFFSFSKLYATETFDFERFDQRGYPYMREWNDPNKPFGTFHTTTGYEQWLARRFDLSKAYEKVEIGKEVTPITCSGFIPLLIMQSSFTLPQNAALSTIFDEAITQIKAVSKCLMLTLYKAENCKWFERYYTLSNLFHQAVSTLRKLYFEFSENDWHNQISTSEQEKWYKTACDLGKIFSKDDPFEFSLSAEHQPEEMAYTLISCVFIDNPLFEGFEAEVQTAFDNKPQINLDYFTDNTFILVQEENPKITTVEEFIKYFFAYEQMLHHLAIHMCTKLSSDPGEEFDFMSHQFSMFYNKYHNIYLQFSNMGITTNNLNEATKKFIEEVKQFHAILFPYRQKRTQFLSIKNEAEALDVLKKIEGIIT